MRVGEIQLILGTCDRDIEEAALFFHHGLIIGFDYAPIGEHAVGQPNHEDNLILQALGLMNGRQGDLLGIELANQLEAKLGIIFEIVERIEEERAEEQRWAEEADRGSATAGEDSVAPSVANAPSVSTASSPAEKIA